MSEHTIPEGAKAVDWAAEAERLSCVNGKLLKALTKMVARNETMMTQVFVTEDAECNRQIEERRKNDLALLNESCAAIALAVEGKSNG